MHDHDAKYGPSTNDYGRKKTEMTEISQLRLQLAATVMRAEQAEARAETAEAEWDALKEQTEKLQNIAADDKVSDEHVGRMVRVIMGKRVSEEYKMTKMIEIKTWPTPREKTDLAGQFEELRRERDELKAHVRELETELKREIEYREQMTDAHNAHREQVQKLLEEHENKANNKSTSRHCGNCDGSGADLCSRFNGGSDE